MDRRLNCGLLSLPDRAEASVPLVLLITGEEAPEEVWTAVRLQTAEPFQPAALRVADWNRNLSPWHAPRVFRGGEDFAGEADAALAELTACLGEAIPAAQRCLIAGYSLAGLFALYSLCRTDRFDAAVSCSGSLWYPGFSDYFCAHAPLRKPKNVYLSLGDREALTRNPVMQTVGACTQRIADHLSARGIDCVFAWNPGNHFQEPEARLGRGIAWSVERMRQ